MKENDIIYEMWYEASKCDESVPAWSDFKERYVLVRSMNDIITYMNDENAYLSWIYLVPDCADYSDLVGIACDDVLFGDVVRLFSKLFGKYGKAGIYVGSELYLI